MYAQFPDFCTPPPPCTHAYVSAHMHTYAKARQSVPVNVDNATVDAVMVIINEYCSLYKCIKLHHEVVQWNDAKGYHGDKTGADDLERR
jgi:hypothetical protein